MVVFSIEIPRITCAEFVYESGDGIFGRRSLPKFQSYMKMVGHQTVGNNIHKRTFSFNRKYVLLSEIVYFKRFSIIGDI